MLQLDGLRFLAVAGVAWYHWVPKSFHFHIPWNSVNGIISPQALRVFY